MATVEVQSATTALPEKQASAEKQQVNKPQKITTHDQVEIAPETPVDQEEEKKEELASDNTANSLKQEEEKKEELASDNTTNSLKQEEADLEKAVEQLVIDEQKPDDGGTATDHQDAIEPSKDMVDVKKDNEETAPTAAQEVAYVGKVDVEEAEAPKEEAIQSATALEDVAEEARTDEVVITEEAPATAAAAAGDVLKNDDE